jgi:hypothetical protein
MTDYKALCAELLAIFEKYDDESNLAGIYWDMETDGNDILDRARAALAQHEPEGPTDEDILREPIDIADEAILSDHSSDVVEAGRRLLARWGTPNSEETKRSSGDAPQLAACPACEGRPAFSNSPCVVCGTERPAPQPADGEVAEVEEVVKWLRSRAGIPASPDFPAVAAYLTRAADLLERLGPPQPIPVSERLPGPEDCDAEGRCWWYGEGGDMIGWTLDAEGLSYYRAKYWLPARTVLAPGATCNPYLPVQ